MPDSSQVFDQAAALYETGNLAAAESLFGQLLHAQPGHFGALRMLGIIRFRQGRLPEARSFLAAAVQADPRSPTALLNYGAVLDALRQKEEALACYDKALELNPHYADALYNRAVVLLHLQRPAEAIESLDVLLVMRPDDVDALNSRGNALRRVGKPAEAIASYEAALAITAQGAEILNNYGNALRDLDRPLEALASYDRALAIEPDNVEALNNRGSVLRSLARSSEALATYDRALKIAPLHPGTLYNRGNALQDLKRFDEAIASYDRALLTRANYVEAFCNRGIARQALGRSAEALADYERALGLRPDHVDTLYNRGMALKALKRLDEALASYDRALKIRPDYVDALHDRGLVLQALGRFQEALASFDRALVAQPHHVGALYSRGEVLRSLGRFQDALASYESVLAAQGDHIDALCKRGIALQGLDRIREAITNCDRAVLLRPDHAEAFSSRGYLLMHEGRWSEAVADFERAVALNPDFPFARFAACMAQLPVLYDDEQQIAVRRAAYRDSLQALRDYVDQRKITPEWADAVGSEQPFFLAYQGYNDRDLASRYGSLVCRIMAERYAPVAPPPPPRAGEPIRVGIVSGFFRVHSNWRIPIRGWLSQIDRRRFRLFGYHTGTITDQETNRAAALCDRFVQGPMSLDGWRQSILNDAPHVLIYPEIGMDAVSARLAAQRLAAVQCNSWGHPDTSGFPTLDYYLSSDLMEPADAQEHYTERLVRLPNLSIYYEPFQMPQIGVDRIALGIRSTATAYWCGQSTFKYLPQFDQVFPRIAREVADCQFVFIHFGEGTCIDESFSRRLDRAFSRHGLRAQDHCVHLPRLGMAQFVAAIGQCDVVLDSIGWSGCNSTFDALQHDLPIVTLPGQLMRGRHTAAILQMMQAEDTIADTVDHYVAIAIRLGLNPDFRSEVRGQISKKKHKVYRDRQAIVGLETFLEQAARRSPALQTQLDR
jgi:protein O-GlcNAc transferase